MIYLIFDTFKEIGYNNIIQDNLILYYFKKADLDLNNCFINYVNPTPAGKDTKKEEMDKHIKNIFLDIKEKKPELILCFGKQAICLFEKIKTHGDARRIKYTHDNIPVFTTWGINYIKFAHRDSSQSSQKVLQQFVGDIQFYLNHKTFENNSLKFTRDMYEVIKFKDCEKLKEIYKNDKQIILDFETSALDSTLPEAYIGSIGLWGNQSDKGVYVDIASLEEPFGGYDPDGLKAFQEFCATKQFIVFNCGFEYQWILNQMNICIDDVIDVMAQGYALNKRGTLKELGGRDLNITDWSLGVDNYISSMKTITNYLNIKTKRHELKWLEEHKDSTFSDYKKYLHDYFIKKLLDYLVRLYNPSNLAQRMML